VTLEDVAREAGVHYSTVSRALDPNKAWRVNRATRAQVEKVARRLGYQRDVMASGLKRGRSQTVAVVVGDLTNPNVPEVLRGIANRLEPEGMLSLVCETEDDSGRLRRVLDQLVSRRIDGLLVIASKVGDAPVLRRMRSQGVPILLAVQNVPGVRLPVCTYDDFLGGRLAAQHLLSLGHRRLVQLRGPDDIYACAQRAAGFSRTIAEAGATEVSVRGTAPLGTADDGRRLIHELLGSKRGLPTGIFVHHDLMAFGVLSVAAERGLRAPADFSLVGYHDLPHVEHVMPPLTSVRLPREELGRVAGEMMLEVMRAPEQRPVWRKLQPTLIVRASTGPPSKVR
jgi:LacI family transcriptional regulator